MFTAITQEAISLLRFIHYRGAASASSRTSSGCTFTHASFILPKLVQGGLIRPIGAGKSDKSDKSDTPDTPESYELCMPLESINLLNLLLVLGEGVCPVPPTTDEARVYDRYGQIASRLGIVNQMMRSIFGEIRLTEFCL